MKKLLLSTLLVAAMMPMSMSAQKEGKAILKNVASGLYWGAGNNWGTRASLMPSAEFQTLHKQPDGTYQMETHVSNGGSSYYFGGDYMDGQPVNLTITKKGDYYTVTNDNATYGNSTETYYYGGSYILGKSASGDDALWQIVFEDEWEDYLAVATEQNPVDATFYILDANFGRNNRDVSTFDSGNGVMHLNGGAWSMEAGNYNICGGVNENKCAESWHSAFTLKQTITVPNGKYRVKVQAALRDDTGAGNDWPVVYANDETSVFLAMTEGENSMSDMSAKFAAGKYEVEPIIVTVTDGKLTIGVKGTRTDTWCIWDNFRLEYLGVDMSALVDAYERALNKANSLLSTTETVSEKTLNDLASAVKEYGSVDTTSKEALEEAISALNNASTNVETSIASYKTLAQVNFDPNSAAGWVATNGGNCRINTWSVEGDSDGSGLTTPFIENWINGWGGDVLRDGQVYYTLAGLEPGLKVKVSALVRAYSEIGNEIAGAYFFVGDQRTDIANEGTKATNGSAKLAYGTFTTIAVVDETGVLRFGVETASATFNFFGLKNVSAEIVPPSPDVIITSFTAPTTVAISDEVQSFDVTMTITNQGDADAKNVVVNLYDGFTVVATYPSSTEATTGASAEGLSLAVGESMDITITYDKELTPGTSLSLSARVDCDDEYADYTDNNSTSSSRVKVVMDGSDMTITNVEAPKSLLIAEGEESVSGTIQVTVKNLGTQTAEGVSVVLNVNGEKYAASAPITVEAGKEEVVEIEFSSSKSGEYTLTAEVISDADVDEENNLWADEIVIKVKNQGELTAGLDLSIENIDVSEMSDDAIRVNDEEGGYTVNVSVYNNGTEDAENVVVKLFINGEEFATNADVEGFETLNLASAEMVEIPFFVENPEFTDVEIYAEVIAEGDVDESNNVSETITAGVKYEGIDVALLDVTYPEAISVDSEEDAIVVVIVKNISEDSRVSDDSELKAENVVVHLYIDGVEVATSKPFSLYKAAEAHAYLGIDRKYLTSENVILTARVTADGDGNESNDWSEELPIQVSGVVTGIDSILARFGQNAQVYTLDGKKVDLSSGMLKKGLYIVNGKKTAIK